MEDVMKKLLMIVVFANIFFAGTSVFAQNKKEGSDSDYYYVNISLEKIWPYRKGYIVQYRRGGYQFARSYIPAEWFSSPTGKGEERKPPKGEIIKLSKGPAWPSMSVYYKNGEFSHVRLYVHALASHQTWGIVPLYVNIDSNFENIEEIKLKF